MPARTSRDAVLSNIIAVATISFLAGMFLIGLDGLGESAAAGDAGDRWLIAKMSIFFKMSA
jgi:hypothetical protein